MIQKVYIVRCSFCKGPLRDPYIMDHRPKYFYELESIELALKQAGWDNINGTQICNSCSHKYRSTEL